MRNPLLFIIFLITSCSLYAQPSAPNDLVPLSPNAASIHKYGNFPIGFYTGQPTISYPLYEINTGYLSVPITLAYNYNGLKVEEYPSWVGAGWTLNVPSVISRQVRSLPDESKNGFNGEERYGTKVTAYLNSGVTPTTPGINFQNDYAAYYSLLKDIVEGRADSEPDMFIFSIPGYSGKFYFDQTQNATEIKKAKIVPHQNIEITGHFDYSFEFNSVRGRIKKFEIIDERGNLYTFDVKERSAGAYVEDADDGSPDLDFQNTWYLSNIKDPFNHTVTFHYKELRKIAMPPTVTERLVIPEQWSTSPLVNQSFIWEQVLDKITYRNEVIEFIEEEGVRQDWDYENWYTYAGFSGDTEIKRPKALKRLSVSIDGKKIKEIEFKYDYFGSNARLRLEAFQEVNGVLSVPATNFRYKEGAFPRIGRLGDLFQQDHWGYYTGGDNTTLLPPVNLTLSDGSAIEIPGNFRTPSSEKASVGLLTSIEHPTGGTTTLIYEPNDYPADQDLNNVPFGSCSQGFSSRGVAALPEQVRTGAFILEDVKTIVITERVCAKMMYTIKTGAALETSVTIWLKEKGTGREIFNHTQRFENTPNGPMSRFFSNGPDQGDIFPLAPGEYELAAYIDHEGSGDSKAEAKVELFTTGTNPDGTYSSNNLAGGMRVKSIRDCAIGSVSGCVSKYIDYSLPNEQGKSSGSLPTPIYYGYWTTLVHGRYGDGGSADTETSLGFVYTGNSLLPLVNTMGNAVGYQYVTVTQDVDGSQGKTVYKFTSPVDQPDFPSSPVSRLEFPFPPAIDRDFSRGFLIQQQDFIYGQNEFPIKEGSFTPSFPSVHSIRALKTGFNFEFSDNLNSGGFGVDVKNTLKSNLSLYTFVPYEINTSFIQTASSQEVMRNFQSNSSITTNTTLYYENPVHRRVTRKEITNSLGEKLTSTFSYKEDVNNIANLTAAEVEGIGANPDKTAVIEEKALRGEILVSTKRKLYNGAVFSKIQQSVGANPLIDEVVFKAHDVDGNALELTAKNGEVHAYKYGYSNRLVIAHAINAKNSDIYYESFESGASGVSNENAKTGLRVLVSSVFTFPADFLPNNVGQMRMSYWYWLDGQWNFSGELPYSSTFSSAGTMIDEVRAYPLGARMTTFCHDPGIGLRTRTDENGNSEYYEYDELGRLKLIRDSNKKIVKAYDYYFKK